MSCSANPTSTRMLAGRRALMVDASNYQQGRRVCIYIEGEKVAELTSEEFRELMLLCQEVDK